MATAMNEEEKTSHDRERSERIEKAQTRENLPGITLAALAALNEKMKGYINRAERKKKPLEK
jgi:hypothetical protein